MVGNLVYVCAGSSGLRMINPSDPIHPAELDRFTWYGHGDPHGGFGIAACFGS